jgi:tetratricopeptide (TPR) repeat protein
VRVVWSLVISLCASALAAAAPPSKPVRKPAPVGLPADRLSAFADAVIADKQGDYDTAVSRYRSAMDGKEHAAIIYNIADLDRRRERYDQAIRGYKQYLALAPNAPDRAAVQRLIDQLAKTPMTLVVDGEDLDAVVFIDGKPAGPSPLVTSLPDGDHVVDRVGPSSFRHEWIRAVPMGHQQVTAYHRDDPGNVVISTTLRYYNSWRDGGAEFRTNDRFQLEPGRYDTYLVRPGYACTPLSFQVPADGVVYVFIEAPRDHKGDRCMPIKVTAQKLQFKGKP